MSGDVTVRDDKFTMPSDNVEIKVIFEEDATPTPTEYTVTVKTDGNGTASGLSRKSRGRHRDYPDRYAKRGLPF